LFKVFDGEGKVDEIRRDDYITRTREFGDFNFFF
jgi:hypothetical protein